MSNSLQHHGLQHARLSCPSLFPWVGSNSCPSSFVVPFSSCLQSCASSRSFPMSRLLASGGQSIGASVSVLPMNIQGWFPFQIDCFDLLAVQGTLKSLQHHSSKASILQPSAFFMVQLSHLYMTTGKSIVLTRWTFVGKMMSLLFSILSRLVIAFLSKSKHLRVRQYQRSTWTNSGDSRKGSQSSDMIPGQKGLPGAFWSYSWSVLVLDPEMNLSLSWEGLIFLCCQCHSTWQCPDGSFIPRISWKSLLSVRCLELWSVYGPWSCCP